MNSAQRRHYDAIQQSARAEWAAEPVTIHPTPTATMTREQFRAMLASLPEGDPDALHAAIVAARPTLGDNVFEKVGTFHTLADGTIIVDELGADR